MDDTYYNFTCVSKANDTLDIQSDVLKIKTSGNRPIFIFLVSAFMCVALSAQMCGLELIRLGLSLRGDEKITSAIRPDVFAIRARGVCGEWAGFIQGKGGLRVKMRVKLQ